MRDSLLRTIIDNPEDDAPRLVCADWLEENGEPERAEFIRVQCELARTPETITREEEISYREAAIMIRSCGGNGKFKIDVKPKPGDYPLSVDSRVCIASIEEPNPRYEALRHRERELCVALGYTVEQFRPPPDGQMQRVFTMPALLQPHEIVPSLLPQIEGCAIVRIDSEPSDRAGHLRITVTYAPI